MKTLYQCEQCQKTYNTSTEAKECEMFHRLPASITINFTVKNKDIPIIEQIYQELCEKYSNASMEVHLGSWR